MFDWLWNIVLIVLVIVGLVEIFRVFVFMLFKTKQENEIMILVPICGHNEKAEIILRSAAARVDWLDELRKQKVVCLNLGMDSETLKICNIVSREYEFMEVCDLEQFEKKLKYNC